MSDLAGKKDSPFGWKCAGVYYLGLATGVIGVSKCADSVGWMILMIFTTLICVMSFGLHLCKSTSSKNTCLYFLNKYGWIPVCIISIAYMMKYQGFYNNPFFILLVSFVGVLAPIWWLRRGDTFTIKIYSIYILILIVSWTVLHFVHVYINETIIARCYYALMMIAFIWMLLISPKVFAKYDGNNVGPFLLFWFGVIVLDLILFQILPCFSDKIPLFTEMEWLK